MAGINYDENVDFVFFLNHIANTNEIREKTKNEDKLSTYGRNKAVTKKLEDYNKAAESYYKSLNFMQRNMIDLFFHKTMITSEYLLNLALNEKDLENQSIQDFIDYCAKIMEIDEFTADYNFIYSHVKDYFDSPDSFEDYEKTTHLILDLVKEPSIFEDNFKQIVALLKSKFIQDKVNPIQEKIQEKIKEHQIIYDKSPNEFLKNLTAGKVDNSDLDPQEMNHYILFHGPMNILISLGAEKVVYGVELENLAPKGLASDLHIALFKFLSDPKRYKMIKMLSQKKWYANELAKEFNITPATMSYHVNKLYGLGIIQFEQGEQNKLYLELDKERLSKLLSQINDELTTI